MLEITPIYNLDSLQRHVSKENLIEFLYNQLDRFRDSKSAICKAIDYAFSNDKGKGGFILLAEDSGELIGAVVMNQTGMQEFIPEYYLIYIAVDVTRRGQGIGALLINKTFECAEGDIALHVEYDNPAKLLYERMGFTNKYAEMRWHRGK